MVGCCRQSKLIYINIMYIALNYKRILYTEETYINYFINSSNISVGKTPVPNSNILFAYLSAGGKLYYNSGLSLNKDINLISIGL